MRHFVTTLFLLIAFKSQAQIMMPLFNGKDLNGWYTYFNSKGKNSDPDPDKVFRIDNGQLHISGKEFGYLCTEKSYKDFHLVAEFKWGTKKWPPRASDTVKRDNGIIFNIPVDTKDNVWPKSIECQIQEGDIGDIYLLPGATIVTNGKRQTGNYFRIKKTADGELPTGQWNTVEIISKGGNISYLVNGKTVNTGSDPNVTEGKIAIQSEGAEIYYRKIEIANLEPAAAWGKPADTPNGTLRSPVVTPDGRVTFRVYAPEAKNVSARVNSDFFQGPLPFVRNEQGVWSATTKPVSSGAYRYNFMVDGMIVLDNRNPLTSPGALNVQSMVVVSKENDADDIQVNNPNIAHGTISTVYYNSPVAGPYRRMYVYLPPNYEKGKKYPVLYLLHGGGDDDASWPTVGRPNFILDNLIAAGKAKPMVIVMPSGNINGNLQRVSSSEKDLLIPELLRVIIPYMEANYHVSKSPKDRALAGLSMGGGETADIGLTHTKQFPYLGIWSSGLPNRKGFEQKFGPTLNKETAPLKLIYYGYGTRDPAKPDAEATMKFFDTYGIKYISEETPGGHVWANWRLYLSHMAPLLFR